MASQIASLTIVYSTVYAGEDQRKYQTSASLAFVLVIRRWPVNSTHKLPVTRKMFPFDDVIMSWSRDIEGIAMRDRNKLGRSWRCLYSVVKTTPVNMACIRFLSAYCYGNGFHFDGDEHKFSITTRSKAWNQIFLYTTKNQFNIVSDIQRRLYKCILIYDMI